MLFHIDAEIILFNGNDYVIIYIYMASCLYFLFISLEGMGEKVMHCPNVVIWQTDGYI